MIDSKTAVVTARSMIAGSANAAETAGAQLFRSLGLGMLARAYGKAGRMDEAFAVVMKPAFGARSMSPEHRAPGRGCCAPS